MSSRKLLSGLFETFKQNIFWKNYFGNAILVKIILLKQRCIEYVELAMRLQRVF